MVPSIPRVVCCLDCCFSTLSLPYVPSHYRRIFVFFFAGDVSSSASSPNIVKHTEELGAALDVSTGHVGLSGWPPSVVTLPPVTTPWWGRLRLGKLCPSRWVGHPLTRLPYQGQLWVTVSTNLICRGWGLRLPFQLLYTIVCLSS